MTITFQGEKVFVYFGALLYLAVHNLWSSEGLNVLAKSLVLSISQLNDFLGSGALLWNHLFLNIGQKLIE